MTKAANLLIFLHGQKVHFNALFEYVNESYLKRSEILTILNFVSLENIFVKIFENLHLFFFFFFFFFFFRR